MYLSLWLNQILERNNNPDDIIELKQKFREKHSSPARVYAFASTPQQGVFINIDFFKLFLLNENSPWNLFTLHLNIIYFSRVLILGFMTATFRESSFSNLHFMHQHCEFAVFCVFSGIFTVKLEHLGIKPWTLTYLQPAVALALHPPLSFCKKLYHLPCCPLRSILYRCTLPISDL